MKDACNDCIFSSFTYVNKNVSDCIFIVVHTFNLLGLYKYLKNCLFAGLLTKSKINSYMVGSHIVMSAQHLSGSKMKSHFITKKCEGWHRHKLWSRLWRHVVWWLQMLQRNLCSMLWVSISCSGKMSRWCRKGVCVMNSVMGKSEPGIGHSSWECDRQSGTSIQCSQNTHLSPIIIIPPMLVIYIRLPSVL